MAHGPRPSHDPNDRVHLPDEQRSAVYRRVDSARHRGLNSHVSFNGVETEFRRSAAPDGIRWAETCGAHLRADEVMALPPVGGTVAGPLGAATGPLPGHSARIGWRAGWAVDATAIA